MANYYKLSNGSQSVKVCETLLSKSLVAMFSFMNKKITVEKISMEEYLDYKAEEWMNKENPVFVQDMYTKSGLPVVCVKFAPDENDDEADCYYVVVEDGYKRLMRTTQSKLYEGDI